MDLLEELIKIRRKIESIDHKKLDWKDRNNTISRIQSMCNHTHIGFLDKDNYLCEICGVSQPKSYHKTPVHGRTLTLAEFINMKNLQGNIMAFQRF